MVRTVQTQVAVRQRSDDEQRRIILDHMGHEMTRIKYLEDLEDFLAQEADAALLRHLDAMERDACNPGEIVERLKAGYAANREALAQTLDELFLQLLGEQNLEDVARKVKSLRESTTITKPKAKVRR
jgi:hypothetical protein